MSSCIRQQLDVFSAAWARRDLNGVMACFADDAVYSASIGPEPGERAEGQHRIRQLVARMFALDGNTVTQIDRLQVSTSTAFWTWRYCRPGHNDEFGCDFFEFNDGLITLKDAYRKTSYLPVTSMELSP